MTENPDQMKHVGDMVAAFISLGWLMEIIPTIVVILNGIYVCFRLYDWIEGRIKGARSKQDESE